MTGFYAFRTRFAELRRAADLKQDVLARELSLGQSTVSKMESGAAAPNAAMVQGLAKLFGVSPWTIVGGTEFADLDPSGCLVSVDGRAGIRKLAYFASALTGLDDAERELLFGEATFVRGACEQHRTLLYEPSHYTDPIGRPDITAAQVYATDRKQVLNADVVILQARYPSFGAGQELEIAAQGGIPVLLLVPDGKRVSRMVLGAYARIFEVRYSNHHSLLAGLHEALPQALAAANMREDVVDIPLGANLQYLRERAGLSHEVLANCVGVAAHAISNLEQGQAKSENPSLAELRRIASALDCSLLELVGLDAARASEAVVDHTLGESRRAFEVAARRLQVPYQTAADRWTEYETAYRRDYSEAAAARSTPVSEQEWESLLCGNAMQQQNLFDD